MISVSQAGNVTQKGCVPCASPPGGGRAVFLPLPPLGGEALQWVSETPPFTQADWEAVYAKVSKERSGVGAGQRP